MKKSDVENKLRSNFPFTPTSDQELLIKRMSEFLVDDSEKKIFILKGYAGTGKTSLIKTLVKTLPECNLSFSLLAPTEEQRK